jgi:hypothetical protein
MGVLLACDVLTYVAEYKAKRDNPNDPGAPKVIVSPSSGLVTTEAGGTASFTVLLNTQPAANVTINLSSSDTTEGTVAPTSLTFTSGNWSVPQTATVTGVDDHVPDGDQQYTIITGPGISSDTNYKGLDPADVAVTTPGIIDLQFKTFIPGIEKRTDYHAVCALALSPDGSKLYAAHWESGSVSTIDPIGIYSTSDYSLLEELGVGGCVGGVAVSPDGRYVFGPAYYEGTLSRFDSWSSYTRATIPLGSLPGNLWINADGTRLIAPYNISTLALVDIVGNNFSMLKTLDMGRPVSRGPIAFSQSGNYMYVGCGGDMTGGPSLLRVSLDLDSFSISGSLGLAPGTASLAGVVRVGSTLYVGDQGNSTLYTVDEATLTKSATTILPYSPSTIELHPSGEYLFVLYGDTGVVSVLKLPSLSAVTTLTGLNPGLSDIEFFSDGKTVYIAHSDQALGGFSVVDVK